MRNLCSPSVLHCAPVTTRDSDLTKGVMVACGEWKRSPNCLIPRRTEMVMFKKKWRRVQYFTIPHIIHMDSTGFHWIPLDSTGLHWTSLYIGAELHTGTKLDSTGLDWSVSCSQHKTGLHWTGLDSTAALNTKLDWTGLDWTVSYS